MQLPFYYQFKWLVHKRLPFRSGCQQEHLIRKESFIKKNSDKQIVIFVRRHGACRGWLCQKMRDELISLPRRVNWDNKICDGHTLEMKSMMVAQKNISFTPTLNISPTTHCWEFVTCHRRVSKGGIHFLWLRTNRICFEMNSSLRNNSSVLSFKVLIESPIEFPPLSALKDTF